MSTGSKLPLPLAWNMTIVTLLGGFLHPVAGMVFPKEQVDYYFILLLTFCSGSQLLHILSNFLSKAPEALPGSQPYFLLLPTSTSILNESAFISVLQWIMFSLISGLLLMLSCLSGENLIFLNSLCLPYSSPSFVLRCHFFKKAFYDPSSWSNDPTMSSKNLHSSPTTAGNHQIASL